jgi:hypothetical protein
MAILGLNFTTPDSVGAGFSLICVNKPKIRLADKMKETIYISEISISSS